MILYDYNMAVGWVAMGGSTLGVLLQLVLRGQYTECIEKRYYLIYGLIISFVVTLFAVEML